MVQFLSKQNIQKVERKKVANRHKHKE